MAPHHRELTLVAVPPFGLGDEMLLPALFLSVACLAGILYLRQVGGRRGRAASAALYCILLVAVVLGARGLRSLAGA